MRTSWTCRGTRARPTGCSSASGLGGRVRIAVIDDTSATDLGTSNSPDIELLRDWAQERLDTLYTQPGRRLGQTRREFMDEFFTHFAGEIGASGEW